MLNQYRDGDHQIGDIAFDAMWRNQLWPPGDRPDPVLFGSDGKPIELSTIKKGSDQDNALRGWLDSHGYWETWRPQLRNIATGYQLGWLDPTNNTTN